MVEQFCVVRNFVEFYKIFEKEGNPLLNHH